MKTLLRLIWNTFAFLLVAPIGLAVIMILMPLVLLFLSIIAAVVWIWLASIMFFGSSDLDKLIDESARDDNENN